MRLPHSVLLLACLAHLGCQAAPPPPLERPRPIPPAVLAGFELTPSTSDSDLQPVHVLGTSTAADAEGVDAPKATVEFEDVLTSVDRHFPLILAAEEQIAIAEGKLTSAEGGFDTRLGARGRSELEGFYDGKRVDVGIEQPTTLWGATFGAGYGISRGDFAVWDGGLKTNEDGELRAGVNLPLLQGRSIDPRRLALWQARIEREIADPFIVGKRLGAMQKAALAYWKWVAAGRKREIALRLFGLAEDRMGQISTNVEEGLLPPIALTENEQLLVGRRSKLIETELELQEAAIGLSLFWRDESGNPRVPSEEELPYDFPEPRDVATVIVPGDERFALQHRPELRALELEQQKLGLARTQASNTLLPRLDLDLKASQDSGEASNIPDDKGDMELEAMVRFDLPLQRREARGKVRELRARITRLERETQYASETIVSEVQRARSILTQSWLRIGQAREAVRLANELADAERFQLTAGESDLLRVNFREQQAAVAASELVAVLQEHFLAMTNYRAVLGIPHEFEEQDPAR